MADREERDASVLQALVHESYEEEEAKEVHRTVSFRIAE